MFRGLRLYWIGALMGERFNELDAKYLFGLYSMTLQTFSYVVPASGNLLSKGWVHHPSVEQYSERYMRCRQLVKPLSHQGPDSIQAQTSNFQVPVSLMKIMCTELSQIDKRCIYVGFFSFCLIFLIGLFCFVFVCLW
jgi:hypothetical protein